MLGRCGCALGKEGIVVLVAAVLISVGVRFFTERLRTLMLTWVAMSAVGLGVSSYLDIERASVTGKVVQPKSESEKLQLSKLSVASLCEGLSSPPADSEECGPLSHSGGPPAADIDQVPPKYVSLPPSLRSLRCSRWCTATRPPIQSRLWKRRHGLSPPHEGPPPGISIDLWRLPRRRFRGDRGDGCWEGVTKLDADGKATSTTSILQQPGRCIQGCILMVQNMIEDFYNEDNSS